MEFKKISVETIRKANQKGIDKSIVEKHYKTVHENQVLIGLPEQQPTLIEVLNNLENYILSLTTYNDWNEMDENGEYIKLEDVLALFALKKE
jgi:hypothetical protein